MNAKHYYQCSTCDKPFEGEYVFDNALYCCPVKGVWECDKCGKKHTSKNARQKAENCCFKGNTLCLDCKINFASQGKEFCKDCRTRHTEKKRLVKTPKHHEQTSSRII